MAKIQTDKTELLWPGKYNADGTLAETPRANLPLRVTESFNQSVATAEVQWRNKLIWSDNLLVMESLLQEFAGKIDLVYIDPPFATGADFSFAPSIGEAENSRRASARGEKVYRDNWQLGIGSYLAMMADRLRLVRELLSPSGSFFLHCDWHASHLLRTVADELFGSGNFLNEIVWYYYNKFQGNVKHFASNHDVVLWYRKSASYQFKPQLEKRAEGKVKQLVRSWDKEKGAIVNAKGSDGRVMYRETDQRAVDDVWRIPMLQPADRTENCGFPTQKPEALLYRIVQAASSEGDLVADFFCGSGTTLSVAEKLNRRWIGCDLGRWGIHATRKRMLSIQGCKPFAVLDLGKRERQHWQTVTFAASKGLSQEQVRCDYVAFLLKLYGARPVAGLAHIHGKKGNSKSQAAVQVGAVDAPMTTAAIEAALSECTSLPQRELHVLAWDWQIGRAADLAEAAKQKGIKLLLLQIPREVMEKQAAAKDDLTFFERVHFEVAIDQPADLTARVTLCDFVIANARRLPEDVRRQVKHWSDYVDYWAVDWDFRGETFTQGWAAYRTRKARNLPLVSRPHTYAMAAKRRIGVRTIDIFGNDTWQAFEVEAK